MADAAPVDVQRRRHRRRYLTRAAAVLALIWAVFTFNAPACIYLPSVPGKPAVMKRIVGVDSQGSVHWLEAERDLGFAWGIRWWFYPIPHAFTAEFGFEYLPPIRFAKAPWVRWRMVRSNGYTQAYSPPLEPDTWPGATRFTQLAQTRPYVTPDGTWLVFQRERLYSLEPTKVDWVSKAIQVRKVSSFSLVLASAVRSDGKIIDLHRIRPERGDSEPWQDPLVLTVFDPLLGEIVERVDFSFPGDRPKRCSAYDVGLSATPAGALILEVCGDWPASQAGETGAGQALLLSNGYRTVERLCRFLCRRTGRLSLSSSADGTLFSTGEAVYWSNGERVRKVGRFSSSVWVGHTLVGVRGYPFFAERVLDRRIPMRDMLDALGSPSSVRRPGEWRGARDHAFYVEVQDALGAVESSKWWLNGVDESGRSDDIESVRFE